MAKRVKLTVLIALIFLMGVISSGCFFLDFLFGEGEDSDISPEEKEKEEKKLVPELEREDEDKGLEDEEDLEGREATFYLLDEETGKLVRVSENIPDVEGIAQKTLSKMVNEEENIEFWAAHELSPVIPRGTEIKGMAVDDAGNARVNFSEEFLNFEGEGEKLIDAVVYTLAEFDTIDRVEFMVEGELLENLPHGLGVEGKMEPVGINSEVPVMRDGDGVALTLYFVAEKDENSYYVPVSRMVSEGSELEGKALAELVRGPDPDSTLKTYVSSEISLNELSLEGDRLLVDVSNITREKGKEEKAAKQIIYTLQEFDTIEKVELLIDGEEIY